MEQTLHKRTIQTI